VSRDRGVAIPLAIVILLIVVSLTLALGAMTMTEPVISTNLLLATQARVAAESGVEAAIAALSNTQVLPTNFAPTVAAAAFVPLPGTRAGYRIASEVDTGWTVFEKANQRRLTVAGTAAGRDASGPEASPTRALKIVEAVIRRDSLLNTLLLPAAISSSAGGIIKAEVDARRDTSRGFDTWCLRHGSAVAPVAGVVADGAEDVVSTAAVWGPGNDVPNEEGIDIRHRRASPPPDFLLGNQAFTEHELAALKELAISTGTFFRGRPVSFDSRAPLPGARAVLYVEGDIEIEAYGHDTTWTGWIVAVGPTGAGSGGRIAFRCFAGCTPSPQRLTINGLLYAEDRLEVSSSPASRRVTVNGAVITRNLAGVGDTIAPQAAPDFRVNFRCQGDGSAQRGVRDAITGTDATIGALDPNGRSGWYVKPGNVREIAGRP
jgi:Tfp pilus assembly protein PilX